MSEMIDLTKPVWTKRGGVVTKIRPRDHANEEPSRFHGKNDALIGIETLDGVSTEIGWKRDFTFWGNCKEHELNLTNTPPAGQAVEPAPQPDMVNHPPHYTAGGIECINAIQAALTPDEWRGFLKGQVLKYTWRERLKGGQEDIGKAAFYLAKLKGGE